MGEPRKRLRMCRTNDTNNERDMEKKEIIRALSEQIFSIPVISDIIFEYLPIRSLLAFSVASKKLQSAATDYIRRRRTCVLKCKVSISDVDGCFQFLKRPDFISKERFEGVKFVFPPITTELRSVDDGPLFLNSQIPGILERLTLKHVNFTFEGGANVLGWKKVFDHIFDSLPANVVESLTICGFKNNIDWMNKINWRFKDLRSIVTDFDPHCYFGLELPRPKEYQFENILRACPNLQEFKIPVGIIDLKVFNRCGKLPLIKSVLVDSAGWWNHLKIEMAQKMADLRITLDCLSIDITFTFLFDKGRFDQVMESLQPCLSKVRKLVISLWRYEDVFTFDFFPLPSVTEVNVYCFFPMENISEDLYRARLREFYPKARNPTVEFRPDLPDI